MDFETVLNGLVGKLDKKNIGYALIGGFALGAWGVVRATSDLDFLIDKRGIDFLKSEMLSKGYRILHESENVIQFESGDLALGSIDFIYAFRQPSLAMLKRAVFKTFWADEIKLRVLLPEDLIGLKVQSSVNNPSRKAFDFDDIEKLMGIHGKKLDWNIVKGHFQLFEMDKAFKNLKDKYAKD